MCARDHAQVRRARAAHTHPLKRLSLWAALALSPMITTGCDEAAPQTAEAAPLLRDCLLRVRHRHAGSPGFIGVSGDFNGFDAHRAPLRRLPDSADLWGLDLKLPEGYHRYRIEIDGRPWLDQHAPEGARHAGEDYSLAYICDGAQPAFTLIERGYRAGGPWFTLQLARVEAEAGLDAESVRAWLDGEQPVAVQIDGDRVHIEAAQIDAAQWRGAHGLRRTLTLRAQDTAGREVIAFEAPFWLEPAPFRWRHALIYQIFTDRFAGDEDFTPAQRARSIAVRHGGNLRGVLRHLEAGYFEALGVNALWLSPMNLNPEGLYTGVEGGEPRYESYHAYWPTAPRTPDARFGDAALLERVVQAAHQRGLRVLLDVVLNHVHEDHPYVREHPDWFGPSGCYCGAPNCAWHSHIEQCWFTPYLPDLRFDELAPLRQQVEDALWWAQRFQLDGLRVDAVPMMPRFVTRHLSAVAKRRLEGLGLRHYLVGETFVGPDERDRLRWYIGPDGLDGQFDFPLMWAIREAFAWQGQPLWVLADQWRASEAAWAGSASVMAPFAGNHDVTRLLSEAAGQITGDYAQPWVDPPAIPRGEWLPYQKALLAQAFVLSAPGAAAIYQGDEFGMPGANDPDNRRPMRFGSERTAQERWLFERVAALGRLRRCLPAMGGADLRWLREEAERLVYLRDVGDGAPVIFVLQRASDAPLELRLDAAVWGETSGAAGSSNGREWIDVLSGQRAEAQPVAAAGPDESGAVVLRLAPGAQTVAAWVPAQHACAQDAQFWEEAP